jgi:hypothetical protein
MYCGSQKAKSHRIQNGAGWYAFFPLLLVCLLAPPASLPDQAGDLGQVTLTMHATISGHAHFTTKDECKFDDEVAIDVSERIQYRIVKIVNGALDLEVISHQNNFTVSGEGSANGKTCTLRGPIKSRTTRPTKISMSG